MGRPVDLELRKIWRDRLARQAASGLSIGEFCRNEDVSEASYYGWRKRLAQAARPTRRRTSRASGDSAARQARGTDPEVRFVQLPLATLAPPAAVKVTLADGTVIRVPSDGGQLVERVLHMVLGREPQSQGGVRHD